MFMSGFFFCKQKTAYGVRISAWSSDVCSSDLIGNVCLALFLAVALMNLKLWELSGLALPLIVNLGLQVALVVLFCVPVFRIMGRDYDAAVMGGGFIGFMLGTTANAMAVMRTLVLRSEEHTSELQSLM